MHGRTGSDVVVVGGGVVGLAAAWRMAAAGRRVTVVDPEPGRGASWAAAGMLAPVGEANFGEQRLSALLVHAARAWSAFAAALESASDVAIGYRADGTLLVAVDPSDRVAVDELVEYRRSLGLAARPLSAADCRKDEPLLAPGIRGGADLPEDHQVDNRGLVDALAVAAARAGAVTERCRAVALVRQEDTVAGVTLDDGRRLAADAVVVAAGCWSGQLGNWPERLRPPVRPVKGLTLRLQAGPRSARLRRTVRGLVHGRSCYVVPRIDGSVVVGATVEERGFDLGVEAGPLGDLLADARRLVPSLDDYELREPATGLRPGSPDNAPIVGRGGLRGLVLATGHYRNGILLAPVTADEVVRLVHVADEPSATSSSPFDGFRPERFWDSSARPARSPAETTGRDVVAGQTGTRDR